MRWILKHLLGIDALERDCPELINGKLAARAIERALAEEKNR
jgi:hypothetical protein